MVVGPEAAKQQVKRVGERHKGREGQHKEMGEAKGTAVGDKQVAQGKGRMAGAAGAAGGAEHRVEPGKDVKDNLAEEGHILALEDKVAGGQGVPGHVAVVDKGGRLQVAEEKALAWVAQAGATAARQVAGYWGLTGHRPTYPDEGSSFLPDFPGEL